MLSADASAVTTYLGKSYQPQPSASKAEADKTYRGTFLGSRVSKLCRHCKIHEHYGYYTKESKKCYDRDVLLMDYLQSTEDTAFDLNLRKDCSNLLVVGAVPFSTYATSYNRRFNHTKTANAEIKGPQVKRTKRSIR